MPETPNTPETLDARRHPDYVSVDTRYLAAWSEMNVRITQRQHLITIYLTLAFGALAAATSQKLQFPTWRLAYLVPIATLMFTSLLYMHEKMIHNLQVFLSRCEAQAPGRDFPSYHKWGPLTAYAASARIIHDYVCAGLVFGFNALAGAVVVLQRSTDMTAYDAATQVALVGVIGVAYVQINRIRAFRHKPDELDPSFGK